MESNHQQSWDDAPIECDGLDRALDAALAKYSAAEPRVGLEQRILAHLRSERDSVPSRLWARWSPVSVVAAVLIVAAAATAWRLNSPTKSVMQKHPSAPAETVQTSATQVATTRPIRTYGPVDPGRTLRTRRHSAPQLALVAAEPKLDQFPSPRPLSEQEKLALEYITRFPEEASLIAQAQTSLLRQQEMEETQGQKNSQ